MSTPAFQTNNTIHSNTRAELVLIRAYENGAYLTTGKSYLGDQLEGKRDGQSYEFVIRDSGEYVEGMDISNVGSDAIKERKVTKKIRIGNTKVSTNLIEKVTDLNWEQEVAETYGRQVIEGLIRNTIKDDLGLQNVAFVGQGFLPLFKATNYLKSVSSEDQFAFVDPNVDSIMQAAGKSWNPAENVAPRFQNDLKGTIGKAMVYGQNGLPNLEISAALATQLASATVTSYALDVNDPTKATLTLSGVTEVIPMGTPLFISGVYAADLLGNKTNFLKAWIATEDSANGAVKVKAVDFAGQGTKEVCNADGKNIDPAKDLAGKALSNPIKEGVYFTGIFRTKGAMEFDTLKELDWSNAEDRVSTPDGVTLHTGRANKILEGENKTRFTIAAVAGIVEPRCAAYVCIKDATANLIAM